MNHRLKIDTLNRVNKTNIDGMLYIADNGGPILCNVSWICTAL